MIPDSVAAYAAAVQHVLGCDWGAVAGYLKGAGFGELAPAELGAAAELWARQHVAPELLERLARSRGGRRKATREQGGSKPAKAHTRSRGARK